MVGKWVIHGVRLLFLNNSSSEESTKHLSLGDLRKIISEIVLGRMKDKRKVKEKKKDGDIRKH
jgi:hypothetical protein